MIDHLLQPPPIGMPFIVGSLPTGRLSQALGIHNLFGSCGSESETHRQHVDSGKDWVLLATLDGCGSIETDAVTHDAVTTTVLVAPPGICFTERTALGLGWSWFCLRVELAPGSPLLASAPRTLWLGRPGLLIHQQMSAIIAALHAHRTGSESEVVSHLVALLGGLERLMCDGARHADLPAFVEQACTLMRTAPGRDWTIAELARHCGMGTSSFAHRFRSEAGITPRHWLIEERMRVARQRLADRDGIDAIADELGFSSRYHFTRVFSRLEGMSPGRFQRLATRR